MPNRRSLSAMPPEPPTPVTGSGSFAQGIRLFNEEYFFEAHEHLEDLWHVERGELRLFLQGLIQVCAAFHHFQNGNLAGAAALLKRGADKMPKYPPRYMGLDAAGPPERALPEHGLDLLVRGDVRPLVEPPDPDAVPRLGSVRPLRSAPHRGVEVG